MVSGGETARSDHAKPSLLQHLAVDRDRGEEPRSGQRRIAAAPPRRGTHRGGDGRDIAMPAKLGNKAAARLQRAKNPSMTAPASLIQ